LYALPPFGLLDRRPSQEYLERAFRAVDRYRKRALTLPGEEGDIMRLNWRAVCLITVAITGLVPVGAAAAASAGGGPGNGWKGCVTVTATIPVGRVPVAVAANPKTNTSYVANFGSTTVSVISGQTNTVTATIHLGTAATEPIGVAVNPK